MYIWFKKTNQVPKQQKNVKAAAHLRKVLSKIPREAVSSAISSCVRWSYHRIRIAARSANMSPSAILNVQP